MNRFDPLAQRQRAQDAVTGYRRMLKRSFREVEALCALGDAALSFTESAIKYLIIGLDDVADALFQKAREWVLASITREERPGHYELGWTEASRYHTLALCNWFLEGRDDTESLACHMRYYDLFLSTTPANNPVEISCTLPRYVDAGAYARVIELFEATRGLKRPKSLTNVRAEGVMSYVLSRSRLGLEYSEAEVGTAVKLFLDRYLEDWLANGFYYQSAVWMRIAYRHGAQTELSPKETVLKVYDHLPGTKAPL